MTTMRERAIEAAATAITASIRSNGDLLCVAHDSPDGTVLVDGDVDPARAATAAYDAILTVLMEPSEAMCSAGQWQISDNLTVSVCLENNAKAKKVFQAMLKAATAQ